MIPSLLADFYNVCKFCLFDGAYLFYALFVFIVSVLASSPRTQSTALAHSNPGRLPPLPGGELPFPRNPPKISVVADTFAYALDLASFPFFLRITQSALKFIKNLFLMRDNPTAIRSFWRYFNIYYLIIVLPAAFMPPVSHAQREPDFHLLAAVILLICANPIGDVISVRIILNIFNKFNPTMYSQMNQDDRWVRLETEAAYYFAVIRGGFYCLLVLSAVLICSSILYGVQIGQMNFEFTERFIQNAWDRAVRFPELASTMYWFRDQPGPFGLTGIPGLFLYGLTTFLPIIILSALAVIWLLLIPFRIAVNLPPATSPVVRVISAESAVFAMCIMTSLALGRFVLT
jgi:hypothetical protein